MRLMAEYVRGLTAVERVGEVRVAVIGVDSNVIDQHTSGKTGRTPRTANVIGASNNFLVRTSRISDWIHIKVKLKKL